MATLEKIRNKAGFLVSIVLGMALLAFILGDFLQKSTGGGRGDDTIAEIYGDNIRYPEYQVKLDKMIENFKANTGKTSLEESDSERLRQDTWDALIRDKITSHEFSELGIRVTEDELTDMIIGSNIDAGLMQAPMFKNEQGIFDRSLVKKYIAYIQDQAEPQEKLMWDAYKIQMLENRRMQKYFNLISKSYVISKVEGQVLAENQNKTYSFDFAFKPYVSIADEDVTLTDADYTNYYNENKYLYKQEASRKIEYVTFSISPSNTDIKEIENEITELKAEFETTDDGIEFANINSINPYEAINYKPAELEQQIDTIMFAADSGYVFGPYVVGNIYKVAKLVGTKMMPDSVEARHILIQPTSEDMTREQFDALVDSVYAMVTNGGDFETLAVQFSADKQTAMVGGNVGWFREGGNPMLEKFCFEGKVGDVDKINSQYGVSIAEILNQGVYNKRVNVAFVERELYYSKQTEDSVFKDMQKFAVENNTKDVFAKYFEDNTAITKKIADLKENDKTVAGIENGRELIRWAFTAEEGEFYRIDKFGDNYVYALLSDIKEKGFADVADVKDEMEPFIIKEKKADKMKAEFSATGYKTVQDVATKLSIKQATAENISFNSFSIEGAGFEPDVIAIATSMAKGDVSKPIAGRAGVFVLSITAVNEPENIELLTSGEVMKAESGFQNQVTYKVLEALEENADVKDFRSKFF